VYLSFLDRVLYQHPFAGRSARRYAAKERPAFGDLDDRVLDALYGASLPSLAGKGAAGSLLDLGCGPGTFTNRARERYPALRVIPIDPSRDYAPVAEFICASGEALPLAERSVDAAVCLSSIRHVRDRARTLRELRRVVTQRLLIVELDPDADRTRIANHAEHLGSALLRAAFGPLVVRTAPPADQMMRLAERAGWRCTDLRADPIQPVYIMELV
jgi:ubiquinone/menaquinone biosynthesis C-methylase UbiE